MFNLLTTRSYLTIGFGNIYVKNGVSINLANTSIIKGLV